MVRQGELFKAWVYNLLRKEKVKRMIVDL